MFLMYDIVGLIYEAFGGACSEEQALRFDECEPEIIEELINAGYLRREIIDGTSFLICRHSVFAAAGNPNQNFRVTTYNLNKCCLLAERWLTVDTCVPAILKMLDLGNMHQRTMGVWDEHTTYLHSQNCYVRYTTDTSRCFTWFPKSDDPLTVAKGIQKFFDEESLFPDAGAITPYLEVIVPNEKRKEAIYHHIKGSYWYIHRRLEINILRCSATIDLI